jgi:hypothetical protein
MRGKMSRVPCIPCNIVGIFLLWQFRYEARVFSVITKKALCKKNNQISNDYLPVKVQEPESGESNQADHTIRREGTLCPNGRDKEATHNCPKSTP